MMYIGLSGNLMKPKEEVGSIDFWGPQFRVSFDLVFQSKPTVAPGDTYYYTIVTFREKGGTSDCCNVGDRVPMLQHHLSPTEKLHFISAIGTNGDYNHIYPVVMELNRKYSFVFEQKSINNKVDYFNLESV